MGLVVKKYGKKTTPTVNKLPLSKKIEVAIKVDEITVIDMDKEENDNQKGSSTRAATPPMIDLDLDEEIQIEQSEEFEDSLALSPEALPVEEEIEPTDIPEETPITSAAAPSSSVEYFCGLCSGDVSTTYKTQKELEEHTKMAHQPQRRYSTAPPLTSTSRCYPPAKRTGISIDKSQLRTFQSSTSISCPPANKKAIIDKKEETKEPMPSIESINDCIFRYDCPNCPHIVNYGINAYAQHLSIHMRLPYQCTVCSDLLPEDESTWEEHWKANHSGTKHGSLRFLKVELDPGLIFKCEGCKIGFNSQKERNRHEEKCPRMEAKAQLLKASGISPDASKKTCVTCQKILRNRDEWRLHRLLLHPEVDRLSCYSCDETFGERRLDCGTEVVIERNDEKLEKHLSKSHKTHLFQECELCGAVFFFRRGSNLEVLKHARDKHEVEDGKIFKCRMCPNRFKKLFDMVNHASSSHFGKCDPRRKKKVEAIRRSQYNCPSCPEVKDYSLTAFVKHLEIHRKRPLKCGECSAFLPDEQEVMNAHWDKHPDIKQDLNSFQRVELDPGPIWKCLGCSQSFRSVVQRRRHETTCGILKLKPRKDPSKVNGFTCTTCKSGFRTQDEWRLHRFLQHAEVDRLSCPYCDNSFGELPKSGEKQERHDEKLFEHVRDVHPQFRSDFSRKLYEFCEECGLVFQKQQETKKHFKDKHGIVEGGKIYQCRFCPLKRLTPANLRKHISSVHFEQQRDLEIPETERLQDVIINIQNNFDSNRNRIPFEGRTRTRVSNANFTTSRSEIGSQRRNLLQQKRIILTGFMFIVIMFYYWSSMAYYSPPSNTFEIRKSDSQLSVRSTSRPSTVQPNVTNTSYFLTFPIKSNYGIFFSCNITSKANVKNLIEKVKAERKLDFPFYFTKLGKTLQNSSSVKSIQLKRYQYLQLVPNRNRNKVNKPEMKMEQRNDLYVL